MTSDELEDLVVFVRDAAREAAVLVHGGFRQRLDVEHKGPVDLVTKYDRESESLLGARLGALGIPIVAEEAGGALREDGPVLYVDPLDGTTNFVHGHPFWCVSIGLAVGMEPILGVVVAPSLALEWTGWIADDETRRATRDDEACAVSSTVALEDAMLATGFPYDRRTSSDDNIAAFASIKKKAQAVRRCGSAAIDLCLVADGTYDGYWERKLRPWDIAGGAAIVRAAGGTVTDLRGGARVLDGGVVATNGSLHARLVRELA